MKRLYSIMAVLCIVCCTHLSFGQGAVLPTEPFTSFINTPGITLEQVMDSLEGPVDSTDTTEGGRADQFKEMRRIWQERVTSNDSSGLNMFQQYYLAEQRAIQARISSPAPCDGAWQQAGPFALPLQTSGYVNAVWANPADSNYILAGSSYGGGVFKTTDGGAHWSNITDGAPIGGIIGVTRIAVNPLNIDDIYLGTTAAGIVESRDGGATWQQEIIATAGGTPTSADSTEGTEVFVTEDNSMLYAIGNKQLFVRNASGGTWTQITPPVDSIANMINMAFVPGHPTHFFVCGQDSNMHGGIAHQLQGFIYESAVAVPTTGDWINDAAILADTLKDSVYYTCGGGGSMLSSIDTVVYRDTDIVLYNICAPNSDGLYIIALPFKRSVPFVRCYTHSDTYNGVGLYKYYFNSPAWAYINHDLPDITGVTGSRFELAVSPADTNNIYYGVLTPHFSHDGGQNFNDIGMYWGTPTHGDIRDIWIQQAAAAGDTGRSERIYFAMDGGVSVKPAGVSMTGSLAANATKDISGTGLACGTYWSFSVSEGSGDGMGGMTHDGISEYEPAQSTPWSNIVVTDADGCVMDKQNPRQGYGWTSSGQTLGATVSGTRDMSALDLSFPNPDYFIDPGFGGIGKSLATDNNGTIYAVGSDFWRKRTIDTAFLDMANAPWNWGFPDRVTGDTFYGAVIALNPDDTSFEGYVLYNTCLGCAQHIYYRSPSISFGVAHEIANMPPVSGRFPVDCIATNPNNTEQLWASLGGVGSSYYPDSTRYRVMYSPDHGNTWVEISYGLPEQLAAGTLAYDEAANVLYVACDVGIYKCDFNGFNIADTFTNSDGVAENNHVWWTCFNKGLVSGQDFPNIATPDLKINHCQGKLYAATLGRSIWMTDINPQDTGLQPVLTVTGAQTLPGPKQYMTGSIDVKAGGVLTITSDSLFMPKNGLIIVEPGGKLVVANSVITNGCGGCLWKGIQARGQTYMPQTPTNQGWVVMTNSVIANADTGVANCNTSAFWGSTGGIIQCTNTTFLNCHNSATFYVYDNWNTAMTVLSPNLSYFMHCNFIINPDYRNPTAYSGYYMQNMVVLRGVEGIPFQGCGMYNRLGTGTGGTGINAWNAGFSVLPWCSSGTITPGGCTGASVPPVFHGLSNGVLVDGALGWDPGVSVDFAEFDSTSIGVNVMNIANVSTTRSTFVIGMGDPVDSLPGVTPAGCATNIGILTQNTQQFRIEGNTFMGREPVPTPTHNWLRFGTVVANLLLNNAVVFRNSYDSLDGGVVAVGNNIGYSPHTLGLEISCNTFLDDQSDIAVAAGGSINPSQDEGWSAGNQFLGGSVDNINNGGSRISYYYNYAAPSEHPWGACLGAGIYSTSYAADCAPTFGGVSGGDAEIPVTVRGAMNQGGLAWFKQDFYTSAASLSDSQAVYSSRVDFGNTDSLIGVIRASADTAVLYSTLSGGAPYISAAALTVAADSGKEPYYSMMQLAKQNPDDNRDYSFFSRMQADFTLSALDVDSLMAWAALTTTRTNLSAAIGSLTKQNAKDANLIMMALKAATDTNVNVADSTGTGICMDSTSVYYRLDSNSYYAGFDSIDVWLKNIGGIWTSYKRVGYYNFLNQPMTADAIFTNIAGEVGASPTRAQDSTVYATYTPLWHTVRNADLAGRNVYLLNNGELAGLDTFSTNEFTDNAATSALYSIATLYTDPRYAVRVTCYYGVSGGGGTGGDGSPDRLSHHAEPPVANGLSFGAYPNPTSGIVTFAWNTPGAANLHVVVTNVVGVKVADLNATGSAGTVVWDSKAVAPGIYLYQAVSDNGVVNKGKLVVVR